MKACEIVCFSYFLSYLIVIKLEREKIAIDPEVGKLENDLAVEVGLGSEPIRLQLLQGDSYFISHNIYYITIYHNISYIIYYII